VKVAGSVSVPMSVQLLPGSTTQAQVTWASADAPRGFAFDIQVEAPGSSQFVDWLVGRTDPTRVFGPGDPFYVGPGTYSFRGRMRNLANGASSRYSDPASIVLG
jgi:hypothetical protein